VEQVVDRLTADNQKLGQDIQNRDSRIICISQDMERISADKSKAMEDAASLRNQIDDLQTEKSEAKRRYQVVINSAITEAKNIVLLCYAFVSDAN
jgi:septal ring factor EnvC (AmiA/AmiB activator)